MEKNEDWLMFSYSFLDLVELACKEIENPKHSKIIGKEEVEYGKKLNISIIYNMKHAIEIFIKSLIRIADNNVNQNIRKHDLNLLFEILKEKMVGFKKKKIAKKATTEEELNSKLNEIIDFAEQEIKNFDNTAFELKEVIDYYHQLKFLDKKDIFVFDTENTAFKYPENMFDLHAQIDYLDFYYTDLNVQKILEDVRRLRASLNKMATIFDLFHFN